MALTASVPRSAGALDRPRYAAGDFWTYASNLTMDPGFRFVGNTTIEADVVRMISVQNESVEALRLRISGGGTFEASFEPFGSASGAWTVIGSEDWESGTWKSVRSHVRLTASGALRGGPTPLSFALTVENETTRRVLRDTWPWPIDVLSAGDMTAHWVAAQNVTLEVLGSPSQQNASAVEGDFTTRYAAERTERVTVRAGTFEATLIREEGPEGGHRLRWFSARVGNEVRQEEYNATGTRVAVSDLTAFRYAAGEPPPPFPWIYVVLASLAGVIGVLLALLARRPKRPLEVWMPPDTTPVDPARPSS